MASDYLLPFILLGSTGRRGDMQYHAVFLVQQCQQTPQQLVDNWEFWDIKRINIYQGIDINRSTEATGCGIYPVTTDGTKRKIIETKLSLTEGQCYVLRQYNDCGRAYHKKGLNHKTWEKYCMGLEDCLWLTRFCRHIKRKLTNHYRI